MQHDLLAHQRSFCSQVLTVVKSFYHRRNLLLCDPYTISKWDKLFFIIMFLQYNQDWGYRKQQKIVLCSLRVLLSLVLYHSSIFSIQNHFAVTITWISSPSQSILASRPGTPDTAFLSGKNYHPCLL